MCLAVGGALKDLMQSGGSLVVRLMRNTAVSLVSLALSHVYARAGGATARWARRAEESSASLRQARAQTTDRPAHFQNDDPPFDRVRCPGGEQSAASELEGW